MSVEAPMSTMPSPLAAAPLAPAIHFEIGGTNNPFSNADLFSLPEIGNVSANFLGNTSKSSAIIPALADMGILWQAPQTLKSEPLLTQMPTDSSNMPTIEIIHEINPQINIPDQVSFGDDIVPTLPILDLVPKVSNFTQEVIPDVKQAVQAEQTQIDQSEAPSEEAVELLTQLTNKSELPESLLSYPEAVADAKQAVAVKKAYITLGMSEQQAEKFAIKNLKQTLNIKGMDSTSNKQIFVRDLKANATREKIVQYAFQTVFKSKKDSQELPITGKDIAENMPQKPQPTDAKSEIVQKTPTEDGSYKGFVEGLAKSGIIYNDADVQNIASKLTQKNTAVRVGDDSNTVTDEEVKKVLS